MDYAGIILSIIDTKHNLSISNNVKSIMDDIVDFFFDNFILLNCNIKET